MSGYFRVGRYVRKVRKAEVSSSLMLGFDPL